MARKGPIDRLQEGSAPSSGRENTTLPVATRIEAPVGVKLVEKAIETCRLWRDRPSNPAGEPGGLLDFPSDLRPIIIGDLHANLENLVSIIDHGSNREDFEEGRAALVFVGDAMHDDRTGHMKEMATSVEIFNYILRLIVEHPRNVYYIRGNHDTFDERLRKSGIAQGLEFKKALLEAEDADYVAATQGLFDILPMFIIGDGFVITHAGPPRGGLVREELIDIHRYPEKYHQLMWNRVNEYHGTPSPKEYGEKDIRLVLFQLGLPEDTPFIVGHNPLWSDGNQTGVWLNVIGMKNHHIIYSGSGSQAPYFTIEAGSLVVRMAGRQKPEVYNYG
ncbi:MAG TPA: metallophosphoesterase [Rectinemataceae bacterium]|nr:metallophosphoesterase [Rectinemataceae bacterium]